MRWSFASSAFRHVTLPEAIAAIAAAGYSGVEIMADVPHAYPPIVGEPELREIRDALDEHGLAVSGVGGSLLRALGDAHHPSFVETDPAARRQRIKHTVGCLRLASQLGAAMVTIPPGGPVPADVEPEQAWELFVAALRGEVVPVAEAMGITLLLAPEPGLLLATPEHFLRLKQAVPSPALALDFDPGHLYCAGLDPVALVPGLAAHTRHYRVADSPPSRERRRLLPGKGEIDLRQVLAAIAGTGYSDWATVDLYPCEGDPAKSARRALASLHRREAPPG